MDYVNGYYIIVDNSCAEARKEAQDLGAYIQKTCDPLFDKRSCDWHHDSCASMKKQIKQAEKESAVVLIFIGQDEIDGSYYTFRIMDTDIEWVLNKVVFYQVEAREHWQAMINWAWLSGRGT